MKFTITVDDKQLQVINDALDMYSRMGMGQLDVSVEEFLRMHFYQLYYEQPAAEETTPPDLTRGKLVEAYINDVKALVFNHPPNGSWGIYNDKVPRACREAYDLKQVFRKVLAEQRLKKAKAKGEEELAKHIAITVDMGNYLPSNPEWPAADAAPVASLEERVAEYEQDVWDLYRDDPMYRPFLEQAGLAGPDDMEAALESDFVVSEGDGTENDPPILLADHVLHTLMAFSMTLDFDRPEE